MLMIWNVKSLVEIKSPLVQILNVLFSVEIKARLRYKKFQDRNKIKPLLFFYRENIRFQI